MKSYTKPASYKLVDRFDNELRALLLHELNAIKAVKSQYLHGNTQVRAQVRLSVA